MKRDIQRKSTSKTIYKKQLASKKDMTQLEKRTITLRHLLKLVNYKSVEIADGIVY